MRLPRVQFTILLLMAAVALSAAGLGAWRYKQAADARARQLARLTSDVTRAQDRERWSRGMREKGYVSEGQAILDRVSLERARAELKAFEGR